MTQKIQNDNPVQFILDNRSHEKDRESWGLVWSNTIEPPAALTCWAHAHMFSWAVFSRSTVGRIRALRSTEGAGNVDRSAEPFTWDESEWELLWFWENVRQYIKKQNTQTTHINKHTFWTLHCDEFMIRRLCSFKPFSCGKFEKIFTFHFIFL